METDVLNLVVLANSIVFIIGLISWIRVNDSQRKVNEITLARLESEEAEFEPEIDED